MVPVIATLLVWCAAFFAAYAGLHALFPSLFAETSTTWGGVGQTLLKLLAYVLLAIASLFLGVALAQPLSGPALDSIARATLTAIEGNSRELPKVSFAASTLRSLRVTSVTLLVGVPIMVLLTLVDLIFPPAAVVTWPCKAIVAGFLATWDLIDYPMSLEDRGVRARTAWLGHNRSYALGFGMAFAAMTVVPFLGLFLLPCGVAGATMLLHAEKKSAAASPSG